VDVSTIREFDFSVPILLEILMVDENEVEVSNLAAIFGGLVEDMKKESVEKKRATHVFDPPVFFRTSSTLVPRVKTTAVSVTVEIEHRHELRRGKMGTFAQLILHQLNSDQSWWFGASPQVISKLSKRRNP
jgi:hypothetical protein